MKISERQEQGSLSGIVSLCVNLVLFAAKFAAGLISNSIAITADSFNSLSDCGTGIATILGFRISAQKADKEHPLGHGRMEYAASLIVSVIILATAFSVGKSAVERIITPESLTFSWVAIGICLGAIAVKLILGVYLYFANKKVSSEILSASMYDCISDSLATGVSMIALIIAPLTNLPLDGYLGIIVAIFILVTGARACKRSIDLILGKSLSVAEQKEIKKVLSGYGLFEEFKELHCHDYGPEKRILILKVKSADNFDAEFEKQIEKCSNELKEKFGFSEIAISWIP